MVNKVVKLGGKAIAAANVIAENAQILSPHSVAPGYKCVAGIRGYYFSNIDFSGQNPIITLSKSQDYGNIGESFSIGYEVNDIVSIVNGSKYPRCATIIAIEDNKITVDALPFTVVKSVSDTAFDDYSIYVDEKYLVGEVELGWYSTAEGECTLALERASHSEGRDTKAFGQYSHSEGRGNLVLGYCAHAEGRNNKASNEYAHAEGNSTTASGKTSHSEGSGTTASGTYSHSEGNVTNAKGSNSHAEGYKSETGENGYAAHAEGGETKAHGAYSHSEGRGCKATGESSHAEGHYTIAGSKYQHVQGKYNVEDTEDLYAHIVGNGYSGNRRNIHTLDWSGNAWFSGNVTVGDSKLVLATQSYVKNLVDDCIGKDGTANGAEVFNDYINNKATGEYSHAEGSNTQATGRRSHAEGAWTKATADSAHAEGNESVAAGNYSHAEGLGTIAAQKYQHVQGRYNVEDTGNKYIHIVGNGSSKTARRNIHTLDWDGNAWYSGNITVNKATTDSDSDLVLVSKGYLKSFIKSAIANSETAMKKYVDDAIASRFAQIKSAEEAEF